jgi:1-acyl-sn-glycerol-3-phosphate acyltransferase
MENRANPTFWGSVLRYRASMTSVLVVSESEGFYKFLKNVAIGPAIDVSFHPWVFGVENIPADGGAILASNHLSLSD